MSIYISNNAITQFSAFVKRAFQSSGYYLKGTVRTEENVTGIAYQFPKMGYMQTTLRTFQDLQAPANVSNTHAIAMLNSYSVYELVDQLQQKLINYSEMANVHILMADSLGRRYDQAIIDSLAAANLSGQNLIDYTHTADYTLNYDKIKAAWTQLNKVAAYGTRYYVMSAVGQGQLYNDDHFTNFFYNQDRIINTGLTGKDGSRMAGPFQLGYIAIPEMPEGGLPFSSGTIRRSFMYNEQAVGLAVSDFSTMMGPLPQYHSEGVSMGLNIGGVVIESNAAINGGVVEIRYDEAA